MPYANCNGVRLYYELKGNESGTPILLLHGFPLSLRQWDTLVPLLNNYQLITLDMRGHGESESTESATMADYARDVHVFIVDILKLSQPVIVVGMSFGGYVAFELWRQIPDIFLALVLVDTRAIPDHDWHAEVRRKVAEEVIRDKSAISVSHGIKNLCHPGVDEAIVKKGTQIIASSPYIGVAAGLRAVGNRPDSRPTCSTISVPTLVIVGESDTLTPVELHRDMHNAIPGSKLVIVPRAGHMMCMERPDVFARELIDFANTI